MGVTKVAPQKFRARYTVNGITYNVGVFKTEKEASKALAQHQWDNPKYPGYIDSTGSLMPNFTFFKQTLYSRFIQWLKKLKVS